MNLSETISAYVEAFNEVGEDIFVRRYSGIGAGRTSMDIPMRARVTAFIANPVTGELIQGKRKVVGLVAGSVGQFNLTLNGTPLTLGSEPLTLGVSVADLLPLTTADRLVVRGSELAIAAIDDNTRRIGGSPVALDIEVDG